MEPTVLQPVADRRPHADPLAVGALCTRILMIVRPETPLVEAARCMRREHVGCVVAVEKKGHGEVPVGLLTDRDIVVSVVAAGIDPGELTMADTMTRDVTVVDEDDSLGAALATMRQHGIRRVPVVSKEGWLVGLLSFDDLVAALTLQTQALTETLVAGRQREGETHP
jgi:CBS domain-containing protein